MPEASESKSGGELEELRARWQRWQGPLDAALGLLPDSPSPLRDYIAALEAALAEAATTEAKLRTWVDDLHAGMSINCVYCGHNYGPDDEVPASMADVLKEHVEQCPEHPMSALKAQLAAAARNAESVLGWYWCIAEYPDEGWVGPFGSREEAKENALDMGHEATLEDLGCRQIGDVGSLDSVLAAADLSAAEWILAPGTGSDCSCFGKLCSHDTPADCIAAVAAAISAAREAREDG